MNSLEFSCLLSLLAVFASGPNGRSPNHHEGVQASGLVLAMHNFSRNEPAQPAEIYQEDEPAQGTHGWGESENEGPKPRPGELSLRAKLRSRLPEYFNFDFFKSQFKRKYTAAESFLRKSIFVRKALEIFKSRIAYRMGQKSYLESVNQFSDRSLEEIKLLFMDKPPPELARSSSSQSNSTQLNNSTTKVQHDRKKWAEALKRRQKFISNQGARLYGLEVPSQAGTEGALDDETLARQELEQFLEAQVNKSRHQNNGHFMEQLLHQALEDELGGRQVESMSQLSITQNIQEELPWPGQRRSRDAMDIDERPYQAPYLEPGQELDWSRHHCFHSIYDQGTLCGKCYVMASTTLAEFYNCSEGGPGRFRRRKFSKDFVLECAQKFSPTILGCAGGSVLDTLRFIGLAGAYTCDNWRGKRRELLEEIRRAGRGLIGAPDLKCPLFSHRKPFNEWGSVPVKINPRVVHASEWLDALEDGPIVVTAQLPAEGFASYAGGVHDAKDCHSSGQWHAMLLVGYGTNERGQRYWRFRNSFGPKWGDRGHFNMAMEVPGACFAGGVRVYREPLDS